MGVTPSLADRAGARAVSRGGPTDIASFDASFDFPSLAPASAVSKERRELVCSVIGLTVKCSLALLAGVSLVRLAGAYQERMDRQGELAAVLDLEQAKLARARDRFDRLFGTDGEQRLIREQNQWIAPNRLRVVWDKADDPAFPTVASQR